MEGQCQNSSHDWGSRHCQYRVVAKNISYGGSMSKWSACYTSTLFPQTIGTMERDNGGVILEKQP